MPPPPGPPRPPTPTPTPTEPTRTPAPTPTRPRPRPQERLARLGADVCARGLERTRRAARRLRRVGRRVPRAARPSRAAQPARRRALGARGGRRREGVRAAGVAQRERGARARAHPPLLAPAPRREVLARVRAGVRRRVVARRPRDPRVTHQPTSIQQPPPSAYGATDKVHARDASTSNLKLTNDERLRGAGARRWGSGVLGSVSGIASLTSADVQTAECSVTRSVQSAACAGSLPRAVEPAFPKTL